ncbi:hypothetical protein [Nocardia inohanensis]|uniref:hypothetical protein n=1 Tax=Nocardia inohanensis TaxID=209246 RepID=UPI0008319554|nr:hypothetical protein [Nocardia inohanensis]
MSEDQLPSNVTRSVLLNVAFAQAKRVSRVEVRRITMPAGTVAGLHVHNCPVVGSIESGSVAYRIEGEPERVLRPGDYFFEPEAARITRFDALDEDVTFVGYFLLAADQSPLIEFPGD